jgi:hypothetical protein
MTANRPSNVTVFEVRFFTVIQYVHYVAFARSTATSQSTWGTPTWGEVGIMYHTTCHVVGQLKVNQRWEAPGPSDPVNCTPVHISRSPL